MSPKSNTTVLRGLTILLTLLLIGLGVYTFSFHNSVRSNEIRLENEKKEIQKELALEMARYATVLDEKNKLVAEFQSTKSQLEALRKELETQDLDKKSIATYRSELKRLRNERLNLLKQNDSLQVLNEQLTTLQEETRQSLDSIERKQSALEAENQALLEKVAKASKVTASTINSRGVIQRNSGKLIVTQRAHRAEMINVHYEVNENALAQAANLPFYTQVLNQKGDMIGSIREVSFSDGNTINYNVQTIVPYKKTRFSVSELILPIKQFDPGTYTINVFLGSRLVLTDQLTLK